MDRTTPIEQAFQWLSEPHPDLVATILSEIKTGWQESTVFYLWGDVFPMSVLVGLLFAVGIAYCGLRIYQIRIAERMQFHRLNSTVASQDVPRTRMRWNRVMEHANSPDEHQWRLAILEADIMLNELLDLQGFRGETMAEKMKSASRSQFNTIDLAWEAHRMRNRVAHEGAELKLTEHDKNKIISLYAQVFREFNFVP